MLPRLAVAPNPSCTNLSTRTSQPSRTRLSSKSSSASSQKRSRPPSRCNLGSLSLQQQFSHKSKARVVGTRTRQKFHRTAIVKSSEASQRRCRPKTLPLKGRRLRRRLNVRATVTRSIRLNSSDLIQCWSLMTRKRIRMVASRKPLQPIRVNHSWRKSQSRL